VSARTLLADHVVDILENGVDVAVRIAHLPDSSLTALKVGSVRRLLCASPAYLAARGAPRTPADLAAHETIVFASSGAAQTEWDFGGRTTVPLNSRFAVNNADAAIAAAVSGAGITRVMSYQIGPQVEAGQLVPVLERYAPPPIPVSIVSAAGKRSPAKVRAFVDFAAERLKSARWLA
jgi:DNA-binding transcriptional LysR family regulator